MRLVPRRRADGAGDPLQDRPGAVERATAGRAPLEHAFDCCHPVGVSQPPRSRPGPTLAERSDASVRGIPSIGRRHCWVTPPDGQQGRPWPGVLVEWRRDRGAWCGRVVYVVLDEDAPVVMDAWVPARLLRPIASSNSQVAENASTPVMR